jgi:hypothetical protein
MNVEKKTCFLVWNGMKSAITEATKWPNVPALDDDEL